MNMLQNNMFLTEKLNQINMMLQNNYSAISRLETVTNSCNLENKQPDGPERANQKGARGRKGLN